MIPALNFNPSFANLTALYGLGGMPHPIRPIGAPVYPHYSGLPAQAAMPNAVNPMGRMQGVPTQGSGLFNLQALMQLLGQQR